MRKRIMRIAVVVGLILLIPLVMMLLGVEGWNWAPGDFVAAGVLLFGTGLAIDFAARMLTNKVHRVFAITAIVVLLLLIWGGMVDNTGERLLEKLFCGGIC
jgi:peptidoglycan/LPS O-acetylase OafA/YrhL